MIENTQPTIENNQPTLEHRQPPVEIPKKRRLSKKFFITLMVVLGVACATVANPAMANRAHTFTGTFREENASSVVATVEQALGVAGGSVTKIKNGRVIVSDDGTAFKAPVQACIGDQFKVNLALINNSDQPLDLELDISTPKGLSVDIQGNDGATGVVRSNINTWTFTLATNEDNQTPDLAITIAIDDLTQPGNYVLDCVIEPVRF